MLRECLPEVPGWEQNPTIKVDWYHMKSTLGTEVLPDVDVTKSAPGEDFSNF